MKKTYRAALLGIGVSLSLGIPQAHADPDRAQCADSYRNAQVQRKNGSLKRARESLLVCVNDKCPSVLQPDCLRWLTEVEAAMPTMSFAAKGVDGRDVTDVRVTMDGQATTTALDGKAIPVDPGTHVLHFEHGAEAPIDQQIVVREGEKSRVVSVSWAKPIASADMTIGPARAQSGPPLVSWVLGGVGAASLVTFGVLGLHGTTRRSDLEKECFGNCEQSKIDSIKTEFAIGDIALGVGVVAIGAAAVLWLTNGPSTSTEKPAGHDVAFGVAPQKNGAAVGVGGSF